MRNLAQHPPPESNLLGYKLAAPFRVFRGQTGSATLLVVLALALGGAGFALIAPKFSGDNRRAKASAETTAQLNTATDATLAATHTSGATHAGLVQPPKIGGDWLFDLLNDAEQVIQADCTAPAGADVDTLTEVAGSPVGSTFARDVNAHLFPGS